MSETLKKIAELESRLANERYSEGIVKLGDEFFRKHKHYRTFTHTNPGPYDDGQVLGNSKASIWLYFGYEPGKITSFVTTTPVEDVSDIQAIKDLHATVVDEPEMTPTPKTTVDDVFNWIKPYLDKHA